MRHRNRTNSTARLFDTVTRGARMLRLRAGVARSYAVAMP
jgi:hypothetical protein